MYNFEWPGVYIINTHILIPSINFLAEKSKIYTIEFNINTIN